MSERPTSDPPASGARSAWAWPVAFVIVVLAMLGAALYVFEAVRSIPGRATAEGRALLREAMSVARAFRQGEIETRFVSFATSTTPTSYFQFATLEAQESFLRRDTSSILWGRLNLPDVVVEATAPVTYTYYVDLAEDWRFRLESGRVLVTAPPIRFNKPAIDTAGIVLQPRTSSLLRDEEEALEELRRALGELVARRASEHVVEVREIGRRRVAEFVQSWLIEAFGDGGDYAVEVVFSDEAPDIDPRRG